MRVYKKDNDPTTVGALFALFSLAAGNLYVGKPAERAAGDGRDIPIKARITEETNSAPPEGSALGENVTIVVREVRADLGAFLSTALLPMLEEGEG